MNKEEMKKMIFSLISIKIWIKIENNEKFKKSYSLEFWFDDFFLGKKEKRAFSIFSLFFIFRNILYYI